MQSLVDIVGQLSAHWVSALPTSQACAALDDTDAAEEEGNDEDSVELTVDDDVDSVALPPTQAVRIKNGLRQKAIRANNGVLVISYITCVGGMILHSRIKKH